jgi:MFS family permease
MAQIGKTPGDDTGCPEASRPWVLAAAIVGSSMAFIDGTVVNVALPAIQADLRATAFQAQWVVESYALLLAALLLVGGALGDHFGRRRVFAIGVAIFAFSSVACALAASVQQLIAARAARPSAPGRASAASQGPWGRCSAASWSIISRGPGPS